MDEPAQSLAPARRPHIDPDLADFSAVPDDEGPLEAVLERLVAIAQRVLPGDSEVSVTLLRADVATTAAATGDVALALDARQYERQEGPCFDAAGAGSLATIDDFSTEDRWPGFVDAAREAGFASSLAVPLPIVREVTGALNVYFAEKDVATAEVIELAGSLAAYAAVAVGNVQRYESAVALADQMREAMASRAVIEQAKGIVMAEQRCTEQQAFDLLVKLSQESHIKLRELAQRLVARTIASQPDPH